MQLYSIKLTNTGILSSTSYCPLPIFRTRELDPRAGQRLIRDSHDCILMQLPAKRSFPEIYASVMMLVMTEDDDRYNA